MRMCVESKKREREKGESMRKGRESEEVVKRQRGGSVWREREGERVRRIERERGRDNEDME